MRGLLALFLTGFLVPITSTDVSPKALPGADQSVKTTDPPTTAPAEVRAKSKAATDTDNNDDAARQKLESEEAVARFGQVLLRRPLHGPAFAGLVKHYVEQGRLAELVKEYEQKHKALPDEASLRIVLARLQLRANQAKKAAELIESVELPAKASADDQSKLLIFKSEVYQQTDRPDAAIAMLKEAQKRARTISERLKLAEAQADFYIRESKSDEAATVLTTLAAELGDSYLHRKRIADSLSQRELFQKAIEEYREVLKLVASENDKRCEVLRQLGKCYERLDRRKEAIETYSEAVALLSAGHWLQRELHDRIVSLYRASDRLDDLIKYCRGQLERAPEQTSIRMLLADVLSAAGDQEGAKKTLADAVSLFPKEQVLSEKRIQLLQRLQDTAGVTSEYERIISQHPKDVELYIAYGQFLAAHQQIEGARNQWKHVLDGEVTDASLAVRLGGLFEPYDLIDDAMECYERAIRLSPESAEGYTLLARLWFHRGDKVKAAAALARMAESNPRDASMHATRCQVLLNLGLAEEALEAITQATELDPKDVHHQMTLSDVLLQVGRVGDALKVRRAALGLIINPGQLALAMDVLVSMHASSNQIQALKQDEEARLEKEPESLLSLMILTRVADFDRRFIEARQYIDRILAMEPVHEEALRQMAKLHEATGDIDAAVATYRKLGETHPTRARQFYQSIADLKLRYNDKAGAIEIFDDMVRASPGNATTLKTVAEQLVRMHELERAIGLYEQSLKIQSNAPETRLDYGKALEEAGRLEDALAAYKAAALQRTDRDTAVEAMGKLHETASQLGSLDDLLQEMQSRVEADPDDTQVAQMLAELLIREFEYTRAISILDLVLRHHPRNAEVQLIRGEVLRRLARFEDATEAYRVVLRQHDIDRDFVLGELGKAYIESGRLDQARGVWRQIQHKLYAGSLMKNNGLLDDAIENFREGIRQKPGDFGLHRNLVMALQAAGKIDESLEAARRLLDLEPDNVFNIEQVAKAYLDRGDRAAASDVASRLFSAGVTEKKEGRGSRSSAGAFGMSGAPVWMMSLQSSWGGGWNQPARNNLDRGVSFFQQNGLLTELEEVLSQQVKDQAGNAILRQRAAELFGETFGKPEVALNLLKELETAEFPLEHQVWLGQCTQRDYMRVRQYQLIGSKPGLRDQRLAELEARSAEALDRDELLELGVIRQSQGNIDSSVTLLEQALQKRPDDVVALSILVDTLTRAERFEAAEPHVDALVGLLTVERERIQKEMVERVRRDFVRGLPVQFQLRVSEQMLRDIAEKWTLGQSMFSDFTGFAQVMGYFRARLAQATVYAKTKRMDKAREVWEDLEPSSDADADAWTMLAGIAQLHDQKDLAFKYYQKALQAASLLAVDPLLQQIYSGSLSTAWYGRDDSIDTAFNKIVEAFAGEDRLIELYDFLRQTDQNVKARRVAEQFNLYDDLKKSYRESFEKAQTTFRQSSDDPLHQSVPYFAQACKLAELFDQTGDWAQSEKIFEAYLADFPDELGLVMTLGEVAEVQEEYADAVAWEQKVLAVKDRLARRGRDWTLRTLSLTPAAPQVLASAREDIWSWQARWGRNNWWYGGRQNPLERWPSWLRIAQLYLSLDNVIAAGDAMERAVSGAGGDRKQVGEQILQLIQQRQLTRKMLPVLRSLAVYLPTEERIQLAFAESLEANDKNDIACEVYRRMLRRGLSGLSTLAQVRDRLKALEPKSAEQAIDTLESLEEAVARDPENAKEQLRLAKAHYYSLRLDKALEAVSRVEKKAPHLEGLHDLLIEIYTIQDDSEKLIEAIRRKIKRTKDDQEKQKARFRLVEELFAAGKPEDALKELKDAVDSKDPSSYERVGAILHYFGHHDEAVKQFELAGRSQHRGGWGGDDSSKKAIARAMVLKGDLDAAAEKILESVNDSTRQATQMSGMAGMYGIFNEQQNYFESFVPLFVLRPKLLEAVEDRLQKQHEERPDDPQASKNLMQLYERVGRKDRAEEILERLTAKGASDQMLTSRIIDRAIERQEYEKAVELATKWIDQQPKPQMPPGIPAQYAGMFILMSSRNVMICKLGDVYWKMDQKEKAFETYGRIVDEKLDDTRMAYAAICATRGRTEDARKIVEEALSAQKVKSPSLLQFRALLATMDGEEKEAFDLLAMATELSTGSEGNPFGMGNEGGGVAQLSNFARRAGLIDEFAAFMKKRIAKNPNDWADHMAVAGLYYEEGRTEDAFAVLDEAAKIKSLRQQVLNQKIQWMEGHASPDELIAGYGELIKASEKKVKPSPSGMSSFFGASAHETESVETSTLRARLGSLLWDQGDQAEAEKTWTQRANLKRAGAQRELAKQFERKEAYDRAEAAYRKALELEPKDVASRIGLAELAFHRQAYDEVLEHLREWFLRGYVPPSASDNDAPIFPYQAVRSRVPTNEGGNSLARYARNLSKTPQIAERLTSSEEAEDEDTRLSLAVMSGNWADAERALIKRLESSPYDPLIWTIWGRLNVRKGAWEEAAKAKDYVRRLNQTTIARHRDELSLVLAGKHIKEAVAGSRTSMMTMGAAAMGRSMPQYSRYYNDYYSAVGGDVEELAALYVKLKQFEKAERLYLLGRQQTGAYMFPTLAGLMWSQGAKARAVELMDLAAVLSDDLNNVSQYAALLAETGNSEEAAELLVRQYRCLRNRNQDNPYAMMFYGFYDTGNTDAGQFENYEEQNCSATLCDILRRSKMLDSFLLKLRKASAANPDDTRMARLALSLLIRDRRWKDARDDLASLHQARPQDTAILPELLHAQMQLGEWSGALATLETIKKDRPGATKAMRAAEAFIRLMKGERESCLAIIVEALNEKGSATQQTNSDGLKFVLGGLKELDPLTDHLNMSREYDRLSESDRMILCRIHLLEKRWSAAVEIAMEQLWRQAEPLDVTSKWFQVLQTACGRAKLAGDALTTKEARPVDQAMLLLLEKGPSEGGSAFSKVVEQQPDDYEARRGLVFARMMEGANADAARANESFIDWLSSRRRQVWYRAKPAALKDSVSAWLEGMQSKDVDSSSVLGLSMSFSSLIDQILQPMGRGQNSADIVKFDVLWKCQEKLQAELLSRAEEAEALASRLKQQAAYAESDEALKGNQSSANYRTIRFMGGTTTYYYGDGISGRGAQTPFSPDWREREQALYVEYRRFEPLTEAAEKLGSRLPENLIYPVSEAYAALGNEEVARQWREKCADESLRQLESELGSAGNSNTPAYTWVWRRYGTSGSQDLEQIRWQLNFSLRDAPESEAEKEESIQQGRPSDLWRLALTDPSIEERLVKLEGQLVPGWEDSNTLTQLIAFHEAKRGYDQIIAMIEKVCSEDSLPQSKRLSTYLKACFETKQYERIEKILARIEERGATLENSVLLTRLAMLRHQGNVGDADALEASLIKRCLREELSPVRSDPEVILSDSHSNLSWSADAFQAMNYVPMQMGRFRNFSQGGLPTNLQTLTTLAQVMGVRFDPRIGREDLTLSQIKNVYARHRLYDHEARIGELELAEGGDELFPRDRMVLLAAQAQCQQRAGKTTEARRLGEKIEEFWLGEARDNPLAANPHRELEKLYNMKLMGPDRKRAFAEFAEARQREGSVDPTGQMEADYLFKLDRYDEAWPFYKALIVKGQMGDTVAVNRGPGNFSVPVARDLTTMLYRAGISAVRAGDKAAGHSLLRQAHWRDPTHPLAGRSQEFIP